MNIKNDVINIIKELSGMESVQPESSLKEDIMLDSLQMVIMLVRLEESFEIEFAEVDMNPFDLNTVSDVIGMVERYQDTIGRLNEYDKTS